MTLDRAACLCDCVPTKGHFCSLLVSNILLNPPLLFLPSDAFLPLSSKHIFFLSLTRIPFIFRSAFHWGAHFFAKALEKFPPDLFANPWRNGLSPSLYLLRIAPPCFSFLPSSLTRWEAVALLPLIDFICPVRLRQDRFFYLMYIGPSSFFVISL